MSFCHVAKPDAAKELGRPGVCLPGDTGPLLTCDAGVDAGDGG